MTSVAAAISVAISHSSRWSGSLSIAARRRWSLLAGGLVDLLDQLGADARAHLLVHHAQLVDPLLALGRRLGVELDLAARLHRRQRVVVLLLGDLVVVGRCLLHRAFERGADVGGQPIPE